MSINEAISKGEIVYCNLHFKTKKGTVIVSKEKVFGRSFNEDIQVNYFKEKDASFLKKHDIKEDCALIKIDVISRHGFKNNSKLR